jgi:hypothetical protein
MVHLWHPSSLFGNNNKITTTWLERFHKEVGTLKLHCTIQHPLIPHASCHTDSCHCMLTRLTYSGNMPYAPLMQSTGSTARTCVAGTGSQYLLTVSLTHSFTHCSRP